VSGAYSAGLEHFQQQMVLRGVLAAFCCAMRIPADADQHSWVIAITIPA
jgi:hypothetical protein